MDNRFLLRLDLEKFFPSISSADIGLYLKGAEPQWTDADIDSFSAFVCRQGSLTIGSPSSPSLSNAIFHTIDIRLSAIALDYAATYTRYSDDLFFSCDKKNILNTLPDLIRTELASALIPAQLKLNESKTRHASRKGRRVVTGIILGSDGKIYVGRALKRMIRAQIHQYDNLSNTERKSLAGLISYAQSVDPEFVNALIRKYGFAPVDRARRHNTH